MKRLEFLKKARQIACQQVSNSSCLTDEEFEDIMESNEVEEVALYRMAKSILEDAAYDAENTLEDRIVMIYDD